MLGVICVQVRYCVSGEVGQGRAAIANGSSISFWQDTITFAGYSISPHDLRLPMGLDRRVEIRAHWTPRRFLPDPVAAAGSRARAPGLAVYRRARP
ncbi:hypothetical protein [Actinomadura livida]|uniref:Uncharacterized protein n=1 Tax=Actinomadura livida TaxID=79909 RepID=A0A7W7IKZ1_9ACTN|nr:MULTISPECIES: hypothetical protein [Actinomadura]MBB4778860.1 hypothetical protein [Actinomadura catellatispora]